MYVRKLVPNCDAQLAWSFKFAAASPVRLQLEKRIVRADLRRGFAPDELPPALPKFNLILCNQVFEHVSRPREAALSLHSMLAPGGLLFWTAPFAEIYHRAPEDFLRYTCSGATELLSSVGFHVSVVQKVGNTQLASGWLMGFGAGDFRAELIQDKLVSNITDSKALDRDLQESLYISCALVCRK